MAILDKVETFRESLSGRQRPLFDQIIEYMARAPHEALARELSTEIHREEPDAARCRDMLQELEAVLRRYFRPLAVQEEAFEEDVERWFWMMTQFVKQERFDGARDNMPFFFKIFDPAGKSICGGLRSRCARADKREYGDDACMHLFTRDQNEANTVVCPDCGTPRMLCRGSPRQNGYCHFHGGKAEVPDEDMPVLRGNSIYGTAIMGGKMRKRFRQFADDPDFLSVMPEINLLRAKTAVAIEEMDEFDPSIIEQGMNKALDRLVDALDADNEARQFDAISEIRGWVEQAHTGTARWQEAKSNLSLLVRMVGQEHRRMVDAQQMIPRQEAAMIADDIIREVYHVQKSIAHRNMYQIEQAIQRHFPQQRTEIMQRLRQIGFEDLMHQAALKELTDALRRAEQEEKQEQVREETLALAAEIEETIIDDYMEEDDAAESA